MVSCSACGCSSTGKNKEEGITFHRFPKDLSRRKIWTDFVKKPGWIAKHASFLCSQHFAKDCFDRTSNLIMRLFPSAVPTLQVSRLKYVRNFNPVFVTEIEEKTIITPPASVAQNAPETEPCNWPSTVSPAEDIPRAKLEREIDDLRKSNALKSFIIKNLQEKTWRQKRQLTSLQSVALELKTQNVIFSILLDHNYALQYDALSKFSSTLKKPSEMEDAPSIPIDVSETCPSSNISPKDIPRKKLEQEINNLRDSYKSKSRIIRRLQINACRRKREIASLKSMLPNFKKLNPRLNELSFENHLLQPISQFCSEGIVQIAGFVSYELASKLQCEHCISQLYGDKEHSSNSLIQHKVLKKPTYPSDHVVKICIECEKFLRTEQKNTVSIINKGLLIKKMLDCHVNKDFFSEMKMHDKSSLENHKILLLQSICDTYLNITINSIYRNT